MNKEEKNFIFKTNKIIDEENWGSEMLKNHIFNLYDITRAFFEEYWRKDKDITKKDFEDINTYLKAIEVRLETLKEVINDESSDINRKIN